MKVKFLDQNCLVSFRFSPAQETVFWFIYGVRLSDLDVTGATIEAGRFKITTGEHS